MKTWLLFCIWIALLGILSTVEQIGRDLDRAIVAMEKVK